MTVADRPHRDDASQPARTHFPMMPVPFDTALRPLSTPDPGAMHKESACLKTNPMKYACPMPCRCRARRSRRSQSVRPPPD